MNIFSMTGFARSKGQCNVDNTAIDWVCEIKSVNGKNFDFKMRLPNELEYLGNSFKSVAQKYFQRGTFNASVEISFEEETKKIKINQDLLNMLINVSAKMENVEKPTAGELLNVFGVVEKEDICFDEKETEQLGNILLQGFDECCKKLHDDRHLEGEKIGSALISLIEKIKHLVEKIEALAQKEPEKIAARLKKQISEFLAENTVSEERLAQEIVFLINKADIREEIDRLKTHIKTAEQLMAEGKNIGRRMDFLCQEFNREANTTCSKAWEVEIINYAMELKTIIEQLREQIQNVE